MGRHAAPGVTTHNTIRHVEIKPAMPLISKFEEALDLTRVQRRGGQFLPIGEDLLEDSCRITAEAALSAPTATSAAAAARGRRHGDGQSAGAQRHSSCRRGTGP